MEISSPKKFLHIGNPTDDTWITTLREALIPLGQMDSISESEISLRIQQEHYDLIIIDSAALLDVENIVTTLHQKQPNIPIIVVTTSPTWQRARRVLLAGAADYVRKSLDTDKLLDILRAVIAGSSAGN